MPLLLFQGHVVTSLRSATTLFKQDIIKMQYMCLYLEIYSVPLLLQACKPKIITRKVATLFLVPSFSYSLLLGMHNIGFMPISNMPIFLNSYMPILIHRQGFCLFLFF